MAKNPRLVDVSEQVFGCWTVVAKAGNGIKGGALWRCRCICGVERVVAGGDLRSGKSTACGCSQSRVARGKSAPVTGTRLYICWQNMRRRCADKANPHYGGRGISVCPEWETFAAFRTWSLASGYRDDLTIERRKNHLGYSPENCMWADRKRQSRNRSIVRMTPDGVAYAEVAEKHGISVSVMNNRICAGGWTPEQAATTPLAHVHVPRTRNSKGQFISQPHRWRR